jgi:hypothetical protein
MMQTNLQFVEYVDEAEFDGGHCPVCDVQARLMTCWECCDSAWVIDCTDRCTPPPMRRGRRDGSDPHRVFCADCADV